MAYVFVIGCARSGTSILGELIASDPRVKYIFEASQIWELGGMGKNESHRLTAQHATEPVRQQIREWFDGQLGGTKILVEKNPRNSLRIPFVKAIFPEAKFIHIVRDGRDVACSMVPGCGGVEWRHLKPPSWQEYYANYSGAIRCAHVWKQVLQIALDDLQGVDHLQVRYEDLVTSPLLIAEQVFDFLGTDLSTSTVEFCNKIADSTSSTYHAKYQEHWYRNDHSKRIGRWRENLNREEKQTVNHVLRPLLTDLGYFGVQGSQRPETGTLTIGTRDNAAHVEKRLIVVLGMHRSGTSAITRGLRVMGVELGQDFLPPQEDNITGFWEDIDLNALNMEMLDWLNSDWDFLTPIEAADVQLLRENGYIQRAVELLQAKTSGTGIFGFKDPRVAILLPFWKEVFADVQLRVGYVLVIRHPLSVCKSLEKRHGFDFEKSSLLWLQHVISSLTGTAGENRVLVDYDHLVQSPEGTLKRIAESLQLQMDLPELEKFKREFLSRELRHTVYHVNDLARYSSISPLVREMYSDLLTVAEGNVQLTDASLQARVKQWEDEFSRLKSILVLIDRLNLTIRGIVSERTAQRSEMREMSARLTEKERELNTIHKSRSWKLVLVLQSIMLRLIRIRSIFFKQKPL